MHYFFVLDLSLLEHHHPRADHRNRVYPGHGLVKAANAERTLIPCKRSFTQVGAAQTDVCAPEGAPRQFPSCKYFVFQFVCAEQISSLYQFRQTETGIS